MNSKIVGEKIDRFWEARSRQPAVEAARFHPEFTPYDLALIRPHLTSGAMILDLGCGTCALANAIAAREAVHVHAVDKYPGMVDFADKRPNLTTEVADAIDYTSDRQFDVILLFGVINSIPEADDRMQMYCTLRQMLRPGGKLIVKSQCGIAEEVLVDTYSQDLGMDYAAIYPHVDDEEERLKRLFSTTRIDPYPTEYNRWPNTHFYAFVCVQH
ncbi:class I SAM-dependent methyltransferase [Sphingobium mellinum]|uniref:class I SAM-dependent methyltransferase n=1 Tax=Sphingobium mellinum TaxID=1387166 RepID=UPI0030EF2442